MYTCCCSSCWKLPHRSSTIEKHRKMRNARELLRLSESYQNQQQEAAKNMSALHGATASAGQYSSHGRAHELLRHHLRCGSVACTVGRRYAAPVSATAHRCRRHVIVHISGT